MDFKGQYLTYDEYEELEGTLDEVPFNLLEYDARKVIDERTQSRLAKLKEIPFAVKICIFKMIDILKNYQEIETQDKRIASESTDGYTVSYRQTDKSTTEAKTSELETIMRIYLSDVIVNDIPILYLGVEKC